MSTIDEQLSAYQRQGDNVLIPRIGIRKISAFHDTVLETVSLTIANGDVYPHDEYDLAKAKKFRLSKLGLLKLSHAAGIVWRWEDTRRIDTMATPTYVAYQAVGALPQADGTWLPLKASYELDLDVIEAELRELYRKRATEVRQGQKPKTETEVQAYVTQHVRQDLLRKRKHKLRLAETGAMLAAALMRRPAEAQESLCRGCGLAQAAWQARDEAHTLATQFARLQKEHTSALHALRTAIPQDCRPRAAVEAELTAAREKLQVLEQLRVQ